MDFGPAKFIKSLYLSETVLVIPSERNVGFAYKFHKKTEKKYACASCKSLGKCRTVTVVNGRITGNKHPEDDHHADCKPVSDAAIEAIELQRSMCSEIVKTGKRPREVYSDALNSVSKKFKTSAEQQDVIETFKPFTSVRCSLQRRRIQTHVPVPDPFDIPEDLRVTIRGKSVEASDPNYMERFLMYSGQDGKLQIFCANTELSILGTSEYVICDGTFEMAPRSSYQLYTIHGFYRGESMPLVWALLPNKTRGTYEELFGVIRQQLERSGYVERQVFLTDFETAAFEAIRSAFPESIVKGCTFHFRQALMRHVADVGLRAEYTSGNPPEVKNWIRRIMGLTLLPTAFLPIAWSTLRMSPHTGDVGVDTKLLTFSSYFERTWISGPFPPMMWSHYDNNGPRTTNVAEGWHNAMNHSFGLPHPTNRNFLHWLQRTQYEVQVRQIQLNSGRPCKPRSATYEELDNRIFQTKVDFSIRAGRIFEAMVRSDPGLFGILCAEIADYLGYMSHLMGAND